MHRKISKCSAPLSEILHRPVDAGWTGLRIVLRIEPTPVGFDASPLKIESSLSSALLAEIEAGKQAAENFSKHHGILRQAEFAAS
jgi:hypothetical protein